MSLAAPLQVFELASRGAFFLSSVVSLLLMASLLPGGEIGKIYAIQFGCAVASAFLVAPAGLWVNRRLLSWSAEGNVLRKLFYTYILPVTSIIVVVAIFLVFVTPALNLGEAIDIQSIILSAGFLLACQSVGMMSVGMLNILQLRKQYCGALLIVSIMQVALPAILVLGWASSWEAWIIGLAVAHLISAAYSLKVTALIEARTNSAERLGETARMRHDGELVALFVTAPLVAFITNYYKSVGFSDEPAIAVSLMSYSVALMFGAASEQLTSQKYGPAIYAQFHSGLKAGSVASLHRAQIKVMYLMMLLLSINIWSISGAFELLTGVTIDRTIIAIGVGIEVLRFIAARIQLCSQLAGSANSYAYSIFFAVLVSLAIEHVFIYKPIGYVPYLPMIVALTLVCLSIFSKRNKQFFVPRKTDLTYLASIFSILFIMADSYPSLGKDALSMYFFSVLFSIPVGWKLLKLLLSEEIGVHD